MSPILVRPVREQLEHDRIIRLLQAKNKRKYDAAINPGAERNTAVGSGPTALYPDVILLSPERGHRLQGVIEVETGESVNHLEALSQWSHFARIRAPFHLYVPSTMVDVARRLCEDNHIVVDEIWSFHGIGDDVRFTLVHRSKEVPQAVKRPAAVSAPPKRKASNSIASRPVRPAKPAAKRKPVKKQTRPVKRK